MAQYNLGQVAIVSKGAWATGTSYAPLNTVTHNGGSFMAIAANSSVEPGVASGWENSWVAMSRGIKSIDVEAVTTTTARAVIVLSDGTTVTGSTYSTAEVPDGSITLAKMAPNSVGASQLATNSVSVGAIQSGAVTAAKLGTDILPANVGIKMGTATPTTSDISNGQIYLKYS